MSRPQTVLLCIFAVLLQWQPWSIVSALLVPPNGYSEGFAGTTRRGSQKFVCRRGSWIRAGSSAEVYASDCSKLGTYWSVYDQKMRAFAYFWNIINTAGDASESGDTIFGVQARVVKSTPASTTATAPYLSIVKAHRGSGTASQVAFISLTATRDGLPPSKQLCTCDSAISSVPFTGKFTSFTQDRQPPRELPATLRLPKGDTFLQGVFLDGKMRYQFSGGKWRYLGFAATMADVAGGTVLGSVTTSAKANRQGSNLRWRFKQLNAF